MSDTKTEMRKISKLESIITRFIWKFRLRQRFVTDQKDVLRLVEAHIQNRKRRGISLCDQEIEKGFTNAMSLRLVFLRAKDSINDCFIERPQEVPAT